MKIALIICIILLVCTLIGFGTFFFTQNSTNNGVSGIMKDENVQTCIVPEEGAMQVSIEKAFENHATQIEKRILENAGETGELDPVEMEKIIQENISGQFDSETIYCTTEFITVESVLKAQMNLMRPVLEEVHEMKEASSVSAKRVEVESTVPAVILCMDGDGYVNEPLSGNKICKDSSSSIEWPDLSGIDTHWGGCEFEINKEELTFKYCATIESGLIVCDEEGCAQG